MNKIEHIIFLCKALFPLLLLSACAPGSDNNTVFMSDQSDSKSIQLEGLDVSHFQGDVDWPHVADTGKRFAITKATEGITYTDPDFVRNWQGIKQAGLVRGAYHFFVPTDDAAEQAQHFIDTVTLSPGDLVPILDIEETQGESSEELKKQIAIWLQTIEAHYGVKPIIYSDYSFLKENLQDGFCDYPLWMADYSDLPPQAVGCWKSWSLLQYTASGEVNGISGEVDLDRFVGTSIQWDSLLVK